MATRSHIYVECKNEACPSHKDKSLGNFYGDPLHDIRVEEGRQVSKCSVCEQEFYFRDPDAKAKMRYPLYNQSTGETFQSRADENAFAKKNNLIATN